MPILAPLAQLLAPPLERLAHPVAVALPMKLAGIERARALGYREIRTESDSLNAPMLRINDALGFVRQPSHITFEKRFDE